MLIKRTQFFLGFTLSPRTHQFHNNFSLGHQLVHQTYIIYSYNCKDRINICRNTPKTHSNWYSKDPYTCSHYSPILNKSSVTSKWAHMCSPKVSSNCSSTILPSKWRIRDIQIHDFWDRHKQSSYPLYKLQYC